MLTLHTTTNPKKQAEKTLQHLYKRCAEHPNSNTLLVSKDLSLSDFLRITGHKAEHLVYDYTGISKNGRYLNANISLPLSSLLFFDLFDLSFFNDQAEDGNLENFQVQQMVLQHLNKPPEIQPTYHMVRLRKSLYVNSLEKMLVSLTQKYNLRDLYITNFNDLRFDQATKLTPAKMAKLEAICQALNLKAHVWINEDLNEQIKN
ncbi:MAG: hypothetical protein RQ735_04540 [Flavobacteriaceae bacterium]|nr:hypothetical protein [Flavobacteriaceae bacterium]